MSRGVLVTLNLAPTDDALRQMIRGQDVPGFPSQLVIVENSMEARRLTAAWMNLKLARGLPYGGTIWRRLP